MKLNKTQNQICFELIRDLVGFEEASKLCNNDKDYYGILIQLVGYSEAKRLYDQANFEYAILNREIRCEYR